MKKNIIQEELLRIHELTYGKNHLNESNGDFINKILKILGIDNLNLDKLPKIPTLPTNVDDFFEVLNDAANTGGISDKTEPTEENKKKIKAIQVGLQLLGYELPTKGADGTFNDETMSAIKKFTEEKLTTQQNESHLSFKKLGLLNELEMVTLKDTSYDNVNYDHDGTQNDKVNKGLLDDLNKAAEMTGIKVTVTTAKTGHSAKTITGNKSRHSTQTAVDIGILNGIGSGRATNGRNGNATFRELGFKLKDALVSLGYVWNTERGNQKAVLWQTNTGGNHFNHLHVSNNGNASSKELDQYAGKPKDKTTELGTVIASVAMIKKLIELLKQKNITSDDLKVFIGGISDDKKTETSINTDEDFYKSILKCVGAPESEENMKFMYAWRQSEGGKYKNNPFNTKRDYPNATGSGIKNYQTREDGVNATCETLKLNYYTCIVDGLKNDIGAKEISQKCDSALKTWGTHQTNPLITQVLKGYESGSEMKPDPIA